jgi:DNA-binding protein Fis
MQKITLDLQQILYPDPQSLSPTEPLRNGAYQRLLAMIMPAFLMALLEETHSNKAHAARLAGFNRSTLDSKLKQYRVVLHKQVRLLPASQVSV